MARQQVIDGMTTEERLAREYERLVAAGEGVPLTEFARRAGIAYPTLTHRYKEWAERVRALRDAGRAAPRRRSPATHTREEIASLDEALALIKELRRRNAQLARQVDTAEAERDALRRRSVRAQILEDHNERLRGVVVTLQETLTRHVRPAVAERVWAEVKGHVPASPPREGE